MVFQLALKYIFKAETEEEILRASVIYGWFLAIIGVASWLLLVNIDVYTPDVLVEGLVWSMVISLALFIMRYTSVKPILGAAASGITIVGIGVLLDAFLNRRDNALGFGALIGVLFVLFWMIMKNLIVAWIYLILETSRYYKYKKKNISLEQTVFTNKQGAES